VSEPYVEEYTVAGRDFSAIGEASTQFKATMKMLGIPSDITRRASIVAYESEMNLVLHAGGGTIRLIVYTDKLEVWAIDRGPGIADIELAMQEGYSTATDEIRELGFGAGMGLPNIKRHSDDMHLDSEVGKGTVLSATIFFKKE
jgi:serine/threonine-protein kinase RsbT